MADVEEVAMPPPQTDQEEEEEEAAAGQNQKMEENNSSKGEENIKSKADNGEKVVESEGNEKGSEEKEVRISLNIVKYKKQIYNIFFFRWKGLRLRPKQPV